MIERENILDDINGADSTPPVADERNRTEDGTLYLVASPIGNLADLSERAAKVLTECGFVAAEDTRVTAKLLSYIGESKPMMPYHEHNKRAAGAEIARRLEAGESCALVTDAGTPGVSDPGADIAALCIERGIPVTAVPGACAAINALVLSGFDTRRFCFEGFLPEKKKARDELLSELAGERRTMIFYASPHDLRRVLDAFSDAFGGERRVALCREMTKRNEDIQRLTLERAIELYKTREPRGEYVIVVEGSRGVGAQFWSEMTVPEHVGFYEAQGMKRMDAIKSVASDRGVAKNVIYKELLEADE